MVRMAQQRVERSRISLIFHWIGAAFRWPIYMGIGVAYIFRDGPRYSKSAGHHPRTSRQEAQMFVGAIIWCFFPGALRAVDAPLLVVIPTALVAVVLGGRRLRYGDPQTVNRILVPSFVQRPWLLLPILLGFAVALLPLVPATGALLAESIPATWRSLMPAAGAATGGCLYWVALMISAHDAGCGRDRAQDIAAALRVTVGVTEQEVSGSLRFKNGRWALSPAPAIAKAKLASDPAAIDAACAAVLPDMEIMLDGAGALIVQKISIETGERRVALASSGGMIVAIKPDPEDADRQILSLAPTVAPTAGPRVEAWVRGQGLDLVSWRPYEHQAVATAALTDDERAHRQRYADSLKSEAFDVDVQIRATGAGKRVITIRSQALTRLSVSARDAYADDLIAITPGATDAWLVDVDAVSGTITILEREDPLGEMFLYPKDATPTHSDVPVGVDEEGREVRLSLIESNMLIAGIPGSGKSGTSTCLLRSISQLPHVALVGIDPKMVELSLWESRFSMIAMEQESKHATAVLAALVEEMLRRYRWLKSERLKKITTDQLSAELPLIVLVIDELADLVASGSTPEEKRAGGERAMMIRRLVQLGRAAGIVVITLTQKPSSSVIPTELRDIIAQRVAHATTTPEMTETILAAGARETAPAQKIPASAKGVGYVRAESSKTAIRFKSYWVPDEQVEALAESTAHLRVELPWLPTEVDVVGGSKGVETSGQVIGSQTLVQDTDFISALPSEMPPVPVAQQAPAALNSFGNLISAPQQHQPPVIRNNTATQFDDLFD